MENTNLDIWAIQSNPEEIEQALDNITEPAVNILYTNCISKLKMGGKRFRIEFDTALYSEENDVLILLMRNSPLTTEDLIRKLEARNIEFAEVSFAEHPFKDYDEKEKEIWFARERTVLQEALMDSKRKGNKVCHYNPIMKGKLSLKYPGNEDEDERITLDQQELRGIIELEDKIIILVNNLDDRNIYFKQALKILKSFGITTIIENYETFEKKAQSRKKAKQKLKVKEVS